MQTIQFLFEQTRRKLSNKIDFSLEKDTLRISLIYLIILTTIIGTASAFFIPNKHIFIRIYAFEAVFIFAFISLKYKYIAFTNIQLITVSGIVIGLSSFWFDTNGLLGSFIFYYFVAITLGNTLLPVRYHRALMFVNLGIISLFGLIDVLYPLAVSKVYLSNNAEKIFNFILVFIGTAASGGIITYFKIAQARTHQALIRKNEALEKANRNLDNMIHSISHDMKAPIASVKNLMILQQNLEFGTDPKKYAVLAEKALNNMEHFIEDLLDYTRISQTELRLERINLTELLKDITEQYAFYQEKSIEIEINSELKENFYSDKTILRIALQNLISNAVNYADFTKPNPYCKIDISKFHDDVQIKIMDNGIGIDKVDGNKIFDIFYRANTQRKGTGLGLYIVKETVDKMKGSIEFESIVAKGTTFNLILPNFQGIARA